MVTFRSNETSFIEKDQVKMDVSQIATSTAMATAVQQLQATASMQMEVMKNMAASQQQIADLVHSMGIGQNVDVTV